MTGRNAISRYLRRRLDWLKRQGLAGTLNISIGQMGKLLDHLNVKVQMQPGMF
jgi:hypothetical protein